MKTIVDIVPAPPGWYARWRFASEYTVSYPVTVWALIEETEPDAGVGRQVVGVDASGQWPGALDNEPGGDFVRYVFLPPHAGTPTDVSNPVEVPAAQR
jgi:hypothetical protein